MLASMQFECTQWLSGFSYQILLVNVDIDFNEIVVVKIVT